MLFFQVNQESAAPNLVPLQENSQENVASSSRPTRLEVSGREVEKNNMF